MHPYLTIDSKTAPARRTLPLALFALALAAAAPAAHAGLITFGSETNEITISLRPANGAVTGLAGQAVGWGFEVNWVGTNNWLSFTGSGLGSLLAPQTNPSFLASYTDNIGFLGGPTSFAMMPNTTWLVEFADGGVGSYQISSNPLLAIVGAEDTGQITFTYDVYDGDPLNGGNSLGGGSYYGPETAFRVTVAGQTELPADLPEPASFLLLGSGALIIAGITRSRKNSKGNR